MHYQIRIGAEHYVSNGDIRMQWKHMSSARNTAFSLSIGTSEPVTIERVTDGPLEGREGFERGKAVPEVKEVLVFVDCKPQPPPQVKPPTGPACTREKLSAGYPCFCLNCRAERKR